MFRWLRNNDFVNNRNRPKTHTLMSGGIIGIPDEKYQDFLHMYSKEMGTNKTLTFSELRSTPVSKMYFDVDLLDEKELGEEFVMILASTIQRVIKSYYTEDAGFRGRENTFMCVVCTTPSKPVERDGEKLAKNGFHIIFPHLHVDVEKAYQIRFNVVYEMERVAGKREIPSNPWADAIDKAPYKGGLKMCGSFKMVKCDECKDAKRVKMEEEGAIKREIATLRRKLFPREPGSNFNYLDMTTISRTEFKDSLIYELNGKLMEVTSGGTCPHCHKGRRLEERTYMPTLVLDSDGTRNVDLVESMSRDMYDTMRYTSIRCQDGDELTPGFKRPAGVPACPDDSNSASLRNLERSKIAKMGTSAMMEVLSGGVFKSDEDEVAVWKGPQVFDEERIGAIQDFIRRLTSGPYSRLQVKTVFEHEIKRRQARGKLSKGTSAIQSIIQSNKGGNADEREVSIEKSLLVRVAGDGSTYCANKGGEHTSNSIYFRFTPYFCYQKCFSRKEEVRPGGGKQCGFYRSLGVDIPYSLGRLLFPDVDMPVPPTSTIAFSRIAAPSVNQNTSCARSHQSANKKARVSTSPWGARSLG
jgi:hypothetical protein